MTYDNRSFKDYRHAYTLIQSTDFDAAPKGKFLYHIVFELSNEARTFGQGSLLLRENVLKLLSVLANTVSLPSYTSTIETANQYNRKKKYQTKIEYKPIDVTFYDDNAGVSRSLLDVYNRYYFKESTKANYQDLNPRDKYNRIVGRYGLDNNKTTPFFENIKIFQLAKKKWFCYTLVNPIISSWGHDDLAYAEGSAITQNKITIDYEAVFYTNGTIVEGSDPPYFGDNWYDLEPGVDTTEPIPRPGLPLGPQQPSDSLRRFPEGNPNNTPESGFEPSPRTPLTLFDFEIPKPSEAQTEPTQTTRNTNQKYDSAQLQNIITNNEDIQNSFILSALGSGKYSPEWGPNNFSEYQSLPKAEQDTIKAEINNRLSTDPNIQIVAENVVNKNRATIQVG